MTRRELAATVVVGVLMAAAGLVWLFGPYALIGTGVTLAVLALFVIDVKEQRGEAVEPVARAPGRR